MLISHLKDTKLLHSRVGRFLLVGSTTVLIDFSVYVVLLLIEVEISIAKGVSFSVGAIFSYFANRKYTFKSQRKNTLGFISFSILYGLTLAVNVGANELVLFALDETQLFIIFAFLVATGLSAALNYLGMKYVVFKS
ncbi:MAG TPA: GtrA family protein [Candidatus Thioglobus sp.]|nr:GtrA family protein [Candidatus Thioglobus sp.]